MLRCGASPVAKRLLIPSVLLAVACVGGGSSSRAGAATACSLIATPATFGAEVAAAPPGQTVCLTSGDYGTWSGTHKAITVAAAPGAAPRMQFDFDTGAAGFTLDGMSGMSGTIANGARNITIRNSAFDDTTEIRNVENGNIVFDHDSFDNIGCDSGCMPRIWLPGQTRQPSGVTVQYSQFRGGSSDGIQAGTALSIIGNEFANIVHGGCGSCHTDNIQLYSGQAGNDVGTLIKGNYIHDGETGIVQFDGGGGNDVEDNVIAHMSLFGMDFGGDSGTKVIHNTEYAIGGNGLDLTSKAGQSSSGEIVRDNILKNIALSDSDSTAHPAVNTNNMLLSGAGGGNFRGSPLFAGGAAPTSYAGFLLRAGSPGIGRATDGGSVGIRPPAIASAPAADSDRDGVVNSADKCPGTPAGRFDADHDGCPGPYARLHPRLRGRWTVLRRGVRIRSLSVTGLRRGVKVRFTCGPCHAKRTLRAKGSRLVLEPLTHRFLRRGRGFTLTATGFGLIGDRLQVTVKRYGRGHRARLRVRRTPFKVRRACLPVGKTRTARTCSSRPASGP
jgi:hypothetical protein